MAEKKIQPMPDNPDKFLIPIDPDLLPVFPDQAEVILTVTDKAEKEFDVYQKDLMDELRGLEFKGKAVHWLNNFGLKKKGSSRYEPVVDPYTIEMKLVKDAVYVYYNGKEVLELPTTPGDADKVIATLALGDPPVGWVK